jgi:hypothetical protein
MTLLLLALLLGLILIVVPSHLIGDLLRITGFGTSCDADPSLAGAGSR